MFASRALRFTLTHRPGGPGGVNWSTMDKNIKLIATKSHNPWKLEGSALFKVDKRLRSAGLHYPWMRNRLGYVNHLINNQKWWYNKLHRHMPFALAFTLIGDFVQEYYFQYTGYYNHHFCPITYALPQMYSTNRLYG
jgi:hypothetical protein